MQSRLLEEGDDEAAQRKLGCFRLTKEEIRPIIRLGSGNNKKVINAFGLWCAVVSALTCPIWWAAMATLKAIYEYREKAGSADVDGDGKARRARKAFDPHRAWYDKTGKIWSNVYLRLTNSYPTISGDVERLREATLASPTNGTGNGAYLYVANHASWLDIPVLCTVLHPVFKFIAKGELRKVPCIGQQLEGVGLILIV
jgi:1-acyl-sn-glycerol-3-phosphate acyltransferase